MAAFNFENCDIMFSIGGRILLVLFLIVVFFIQGPPQFSLSTQIAAIKNSIKPPASAATT